MSVVPPFGNLITAMVTPFAEDGSLDPDGAAELARYLVDEQDNDALVISGTTGESPTTTAGEKVTLLRAVIEAVGDRAKVIAGVGSFDTRHTIETAHEAEAAGANGLLVVTPYYSKPPQEGLVQHFRTVADETALPIMVYDIPHRTGTPIATESMLRLAEHPRIVAVKDAKKDFEATSIVISRTDLAYYSGDDAVTLPMLAIGGVGVVGTSTHFTGRGMKRLIQAFAKADTAEALRLHQELLPVLTGVFAAQGVSMVKAGLELQGRGVGGLRLPQVPATDDQRETFAGLLRAAGLLD
ncbi:4-hydroxy-tetrahydrodipicolinate synthase [Microlunatus speluncae]|uniref:4-hydroxy-tetrahydrodipicolinate synthase n=1 Tax=Microlunatus speluncae TaxID=2594267 RepID=UPI0012666D5C|nr:4-hydroxy-tetrahydrodipicolinate synthase [Microlunatus speluncae]